MAHPLLALSIPSAPVSASSSSSSDAHILHSTGSSSPLLTAFQSPAPSGRIAAAPGPSRVSLAGFCPCARQGIRVDAAAGGRGRVSAFLDNDAVDLNPSSMVPVMRKEFGAFGGGATLEKSKLDLSSTSSTKSRPQLEDGDNGGNIGKGNRHGGGDSGDDGGDDDAYFGDGDEEEDGGNDGLFGKRIIVPEIFDRKILEAVMKEWYRTMSDLPLGFKQAFELGLVSSAQLVRFFSMSARPTFSRALYRLFPPSLPRMLADPSWYPYKICLEQLATIGYGCWWEYQRRGERIKDEWDLALCNVLTLAACNLAVVWSLAPTRSYGSTFKYEFQNVLQKLPNNIFDKSYSMRNYNMGQRLCSFFYKAGVLGFFGAFLGAAGAGLSKACITLRKQRGASDESSVPLPSVQTSALGYGAFLGLSGNLRYQLVYGAERAMQEHLNHLGVVILCSSALRLLSIRVGDASRVALLGLDSDAKKARDGKAYRRPSLPSMESLKNGFSMSGLLDAKKDIFAKRKVKRRVMAVQ
ncbi:protein RETICULATA-RELATED 1, chloroplastic [Selaginella moellendorffii]|nr:protein RETICULATA-RELATED 1, chloroplastic [Selaginella moellendorffii]|eukprot:XP_002975039.2 protein RETICULATA-RELATED 1, chloroplastic [Selaginella moellendorffii]